MLILSLLVAATAVACLAAAAFLEAANSWGPFSDPALFGIALAGFGIAYATWRGPAISAFLRVLAWIFAIEYIATALGYLAARAGFWPAFLKGAQIPVSLPVTIAVFGIIIWLISFIPVVNQITRLADPYFASHEPKTFRFGPLGPYTVREGRFGGWLVAALVVINQAQVGISVRLSFFSRDWFNAIQKKDAATFWTLLYTVFLVWAAIYIASYLVEVFMRSVLQINWRRWMTEKYSNDWLKNGGIYRMGLIGEGADNPDQRIAEDIKNYIEYTYSYSISLIQQISTLVSFSIILWTIPAEFVIPGTNYVVPGLPFWVAIIYSVFGTWITHWIGKPLVALQFRQERYEADFRFSLARLREYGEQVALLRGERAERAILGGHFAELIINFFRIVWRTLRLTTFTAFYGQISPILPYVIVAPYYFLNKITLGQMQQTAGAFGNVSSALNFFVDRYQSLAIFKAVVDRLNTFGVATAQAQALGKTDPYIIQGTSSTGDLRLKDVHLTLPAGREIVHAQNLVLPKGKATLVTGPSGSGKSTMFRAIAGIWPYGHGTIEFPENVSGGPATVMLLPQRPYVANGSLKRAASYPATVDVYSDETVRDALKKARLEQFIDQLDVDDEWAQRLSGGEQQRLAIAHALLAKPDWLFLDEATSALDEKLEKHIYEMLKAELPGTTIVSIGHRSTLIELHDARLDMQPNDAGVHLPVLQEKQALA
jgi:vitamin B12/bleomycin/antimicrobial peptide transport system ATP-binding/permease protein